MYRQIAAAAEELPDGVSVEILFVDDGSTDNGAKLLKKLADSDPRVRPVFQKNGGIASARNAGLEHAAGEYICFVDQDDVMHPDMLSVLYADLVTSGADFVQAKADSVRRADGADPPKEPERRAYGAGDTKTAYTDNAHGQNCAAAEPVSDCTVIERGTTAYTQYLQTLVMRGLVHYPGCEVTGSIWCCMFRTDFLRENNISFYRFCDYEDDWIFLILAMVHAGTFAIEARTVYSWVIHNASESHNRVKKDRYLDDLYEKHRLLRAFFWEALKHADLTEAQEERFGCELQKQALLWSLSNETGRGIRKHSEREIVAIMTHVVETEKYEGIYRRINRRPLYISTAGAKGFRRRYYAFRDKLLTFLLLHGQIPLAVRMNREMLHGRWHI
jgi:glycosyltransferase involved in cell wall biosynthesis